MMRNKGNNLRQRIHFFTERPVFLSVIITVLLSCFVIIPLSYTANRAYEQLLIHQKRIDVEKSVIQLDHSFDNTVIRRISVLNGLESFVMTHMEQFTNEEFTLYASGLISSIQGIRNVIIAPGGINQHVYPVEGNEEALGHDLLNDDREDVIEDVQLAIQTGEIIMSGPYELRQGGTGIVFRKAIYQEGSFWGLVSVTMDLESLFAIAGFRESMEFIDLAVRSEDLVLLGDDALFLTDPVMHSLDLPQNSLELVAAPVGGWSAAIAADRNVFIILSSLVACLLAALVYVLSYQNRKSNLRVIQRTRELNDANRQLVEELNQKIAALQLLAASEKRFSVAMDHVPHGIIIYDKNVQIQYVNRAITKLTGKPATDFLGRTDPELWPKEIYQEYMPTLERTSREKKVGSVETDLAISPGSLTV